MISDDPGRYREQAEYCRQQSKKAFDPKEKEAWLKVAGDWLQLAEDAQRRCREKPPDGEHKA